MVHCASVDMHASHTALHDLSQCGVQPDLSADGPSKRGRLCMLIGTQFVSVREETNITSLSRKNLLCVQRQIVQGNKKLFPVVNLN